MSPDKWDSFSVDKGKGSVEHNRNGSEVSEISQCEEIIGCLVKEKNAVPHIDDIVKFSEESQLIEFCEKYKYPNVIAKANSIDPDRQDWKLEAISVQDAWELRDEACKSIQVQLNEKAKPMFVRKTQLDDRIERIDKSRRNDSGSMAERDALVSEVIVINNSIMAAKGIEGTSELELAQKELAIHKSLLKVVGDTLDGVTSLSLSDFSPMSKAWGNDSFKKKYASPDVLRKEKDLSDKLWISFTKEFMDQYEAIKDDYYSFLREYHKLTAAPWKEPSTKMERIFNDFDDFHQTLTLYIYHMALKSKEGSLWSNNKDLPLVRRKWSIATKSTNIVAGMVQYNARKSAVDETDPKRQREYFRVVAEYNRLFYEHRPHRVANKLLERAPESKNALNNEFMGNLEIMQRDMRMLNNQVRAEQDRLIKESQDVWKKWRVILDILEQRGK